MEKNAKKTNKKPFLVAGFALLLALIGCVGGVTYSKYISKTDVPSTQATVAKWGYVVTANSDKLFGEKYAKDGATNTAIVDPTNGKVIVSATSGTNVIAPGATGSMTITVNGTAEVMASLTIKIADGFKDISLSDATTPNKNTYNPLKWTATAKVTVDSVEGATDTIAENKTLSEVQTALNSYSQKFETAKTIKAEFTLSYTWEFERTGAEATTTLVNSTVTPETTISSDEADTILGMLANGTISASDAQYGYASTWTAEKTVSFSLSATLAQIQA